VVGPVVTQNRKPPPNCLGCGLAMVRRGHSHKRPAGLPDDVVMHGGRGYCRRCYPKRYNAGKFVIGDRRAPCGTVAAYRRHSATDPPTEPCEPCRAARREADRAYRAQAGPQSRPAVTESPVRDGQLRPGVQVHLAARTAATFALADPDPAGALALYLDALGLREPV
jgi:hypothetical protein